MRGVCGWAMNLGARGGFVIFRETPRGLQNYAEEHGGDMGGKDLGRNVQEIGVGFVGGWSSKPRQ